MDETAAKIIDANVSDAILKYPTLVSMKWPFSIIWPEFKKDYMLRVNL